MDALRQSNDSLECSTSAPAWRASGFSFPLSATAYHGSALYSSPFSKPTLNTTEIKPSADSISAVHVPESAAAASATSEPASSSSGSGTANIWPVLAPQPTSVFFNKKPVLPHSPSAPRALDTSSPVGMRNPSLIGSSRAIAQPEVRTRKGIRKNQPGSRLYDLDLLQYAGRRVSDLRTATKEQLSLISCRMARLDPKLEENPHAGIHPLHLAAMYEKVDILAGLIQRGIDIHASDAEGRTALMHAAAHSSVHSARTLLAAGANAQAVDNYSRTALHMAADSGADKGAPIVDMLLQAGANINAVDNHGCTPCICAAGHNSYKIFAMLLDAGADTRLATKGGWTCLKAAVQRNNAPIVKALLQLDVAAAELDAAMCKGSDATIVSMLLKAGAHPGAVAGDGTTMLRRILNFEQRWVASNFSTAILTLLASGASLSDTIVPAVS